MNTGKPIDRSHLLLPRERIGDSFMQDAKGNLQRSVDAPQRPAVVTLSDSVLDSAGSFDALESSLLRRAVEQVDGLLIAAKRPGRRLLRPATQKPPVSRPRVSTWANVLPNSFE